MFLKILDDPYYEPSSWLGKMVAIYIYVYVPLIAITIRAQLIMRHHARCANKIIDFLLTFVNELSNTRRLTKLNKAYLAIGRSIINNVIYKIHKLYFLYAHTVVPSLRG